MNILNSMKAKSIEKAEKLIDIPNVGPRIAADLVFLGYKKPKDLVGADGFKLYETLCKKTGVRHDPCVLDTFLAIADFVAGGPPRKWFKFTALRKKKYKI